MPTNLTPEAEAAWDRYQQASGLTERISTLEEYISLVPKHKGVEKHLRQVKITLSKLKAEQEQEKSLRKGTGEKWMVPKEGDVQIAVAGFPSSGKSAFFNFLVGKEVFTIGTYPFTTIKPDVATIQAKGAIIQVVDLPALVEGAAEGQANGQKVFAQIRNADLVTIVIDLTVDPIEQIKILLEEFKKAKIKLNESKSKIHLEKASGIGIVTVNADFFPGGKEGLVSYLQTMRINSGIITLDGPITEEELFSFLRIKSISLHAIIIATKGDAPASKVNFSKLRDYIVKNYKDLFEIIPVSTKFTGSKMNNPEVITEQLFQSVGFIRVYTRNEEGEVAQKPIVLKKSSTVIEVAEKLGSNFVKNFRYAKIWGTSMKFDGQRAGIDHELSDQDIVQIFS